MVQPRLSVGTSKYWLRARSGNRNGGKILVSVDSLYSIFKENRVRATPKSKAEAPTTTTSSRTAPTVPTIRKSARLVEKRAALLRCTRGGPQYWLRTRSRGNKRSLLVSVKSLYPSAEPQEGKDEESKSDAKACSGCCQQTPQRRKSARLFEKRAASLLSSRTGRPGVRRKISKFKRKKKHICWLYKGTPWLGGCYDAKLAAEEHRSKGLRLDCDAGNCKDGGGADMASPSGKRHHDPAFRPVLQRLTERGEEDLLQSILEKLPPANLLQAARVCRSWARLCEPAFRDECHRKGWSLPRLPRGATPAFPVRDLSRPSLLPSHHRLCNSCFWFGSSCPSLERPYECMYLAGLCSGGRCTTGTRAERAARWASSSCGRRSTATSSSCCAVVASVSRTCATGWCSTLSTCTASRASSWLPTFLPGAPASSCQLQLQHTSARPPSSLSSPSSPPSLTLTHLLPHVQALACSLICTNFSFPSIPRPRKCTYVR